MRTTRIYLPAELPGPHAASAANVSFFATAAGAAQAAGYRACLRLPPRRLPRLAGVGRPGRPGGPGHSAHPRRGGRPPWASAWGLAATLGYSERQLHRLLVAEVGTGALALARAQRAQTARLLVETTDLPVAHVAFAAGFASVRQCNDTVRSVYARTPTERAAPGPPPIRGGSGGGQAGAANCRSEATPRPEGIALRLAYRTPYDAGSVLTFLQQPGHPRRRGRRR